jgi:hypothetical protein
MHETLEHDSLISEYVKADSAERRVIIMSVLNQPSCGTGLVRLTNKSRVIKLRIKRYTILNTPADICLPLKDIPKR